MVIGSHKRMMVYRKTDFKCSVCGNARDLTCVCFIPEWVRLVDDDVANMIPMCDECRINRGVNFIELGDLKYLPKLFIEQLMEYYKTMNKYLHKYVRDYGRYRTRGKLDVDRNMQILGSYDEYIKDNNVDWKNL